MLPVCGNSVTVAGAGVAASPLAETEPLAMRRHRAAPERYASRLPRSRLSRPRSKGAFGGNYPPPRELDRDRRDHPQFPRVHRGDRAGLVVVIIVVVIIQRVIRLTVEIVRGMYHDNCWYKSQKTRPAATTTPEGKSTNPAPPTRPRASWSPTACPCRHGHPQDHRQPYASPSPSPMTYSPRSALDVARRTNLSPRIRRLSGKGHCSGTLIELHTQGVLARILSVDSLLHMRASVV